MASTVKNIFKGYHLNGDTQEGGGGWGNNGRPGRIEHFPGRTVSYIGIIRYFSKSSIVKNTRQFTKDIIPKYGYL